MMIKRFSVSAMALAVAAAAFGGGADAGVVINIYQVGSDVVASGSGTLDVTGLIGLYLGMYIYWK
jgi:hypothetical protein